MCLTVYQGSRLAFSYFKLSIIENYENFYILKISVETKWTISYKLIFIFIY
jgi:hypothetical protein